MLTINNTDELREDLIRILYEKVLEREPDESGLKDHVSSGLPLEYVYALLMGSGERELLVAEKERLESERKASRKLPLSLAMIVKDNEDSVALAINSVKEIVSEIVVLDTGSSDSTPTICENLGARVYKCGFTDFGSMKTLVSHLCRQSWVFVLDSDEMVLAEDLDLFRDLIEDDEADSWALPRKRWFDLEMTYQLEKDVYPDLQIRLFKNKLNIKYIRRVHETLSGAAKTSKALNGPHIQHFQDSFKSGARLENRNSFYKKLYEMDLADGVEHTGPAVAEIDDVND